MVIPKAAEETLHDRLGHPIRVGDAVRIAGLPDLAEVQAVDPRYGVVIVLVPGRTGKMGRMLRAQEVEYLGAAAPG